MFDLFGVDQDRFVEVTKYTTTQLVAITSLLLNKKIISEEEFNQYIKMAEKQVEESFQNKKLEQEKEFKENNPIMAKMFGIE